jgi:hypothetical protein
MRTLRIWLLVIGWVLLLGLAQVQAQGTGYAQATMINHTRYTMDFFVDGQNCCRALAGGFCSTHVRPGVHVFYAVAADGHIRTPSQQVKLEAGETWNFPVEIRTRTVH